MGVYVYVCLTAMMHVWKSEDICRNWFFHYSMSVESNSGLGANAFTLLSPWPSTVVQYTLDFT